MRMSDRYKHPISRRFTGRPLGVENFNLEIRESWIFTIYGQNGSGKTTTLRLNLGAFSRDTRRCLWHGTIYIEYFTYMKYAEFFLIHALFDLWFIGYFNRLRCIEYIQAG
jgi:ABC-type multidrug transport system ATPase subunit